MKFHKRIVTSLCAGALLVGVAACGEAGSTGVDGMTRIDVGIYPNSSLSFPFVVAQGQGFFSDEGLDAQAVNAKAGPELIAGLIGKTTSVAMATLADTLPAMAQGQDLIGFAPFGRLDLVLATPEDGGVADVKNLVGKNVGVSQRGALSEQFARQYLSEQGVDPDSVTFIAVGGLVTQEASLRNKKIDAAVLSTSSIIKMEGEGFKMRIFADTLGGKGGRMEDLSHSLFVTTDSFRKGNSDTIQGFCTAVGRAAEWIADDANREAGAQSLATLLNIPAKDAGELWDRIHKSWTYEMDEARWDENTKWYLAGDEKDLPFAKSVIADCG